MEIDTLLRSLEATSVATAIRENESLFPWVESFHVLAITLVIGSIAIVDLRLMGLASRERAAGRVASEVLRCTWAAFALAAISGAGESRLKRPLCRRGLRAPFPSFSGSGWSPSAAGSDSACTPLL